MPMDVPDVSIGKEFAEGPIQLLVPGVKTPNAM